MEGWEIIELGIRDMEVPVPIFLKQIYTLVS